MQITNKIKTILAIVLFPLFVNSQSYDITFENGETKKIEFAYDNPDHLSRFNMTYCFFGFSVLGAEGLLTYQLKPEYRINKKMMVTGTLNSVYARNMDPVIGDRTTVLTEQYKPTLGATGLFHYALFSIRKPVKKKIAVDFDAISTYTAKLPRVIAKTLLADGGIYYMRSPTGVNLGSLNPSSDTTYQTINTRSTSVGFGLSFYKHQSYEIIANGISRSYFRYSRLYFHMTYALMQNFDLTGINYASGYENATSFEPTTGFVFPTFSKIGWRFGLDKHLGFKNSNFSGTIGFEYAVLPFMKTINPSVIETSPREYFSIHFGIGFGEKPLSN